MFENSEIVKTSTAPTRELNFQGLEGFGSVYFCCFLGLVSGWLWDGILEILGWILGAFWLPKSMKNGIDFGSDV